MQNDSFRPEPDDQSPERSAPPVQGRTPITDDLIDPEESRGYVENDIQNQDITAHEMPDEVDAFGNRLNHEGDWVHRAAPELTEEDVAETHDWRKSPEAEADPSAGWINEKVADELAGERVDDVTGRPLE
jgi:hypothetical protein